MRKRYYIASGAQANYRGILVNARCGVHPDGDTVRKMGKTLAEADLRKRTGVTVLCIRRMVGADRRAARTDVIPQPNDKLIVVEISKPLDSRVFAA